VRKGETLDPHRLKAFLFETVDSEFATSIRHDDVIVAGGNFGCGSAMEVAVTAVMAAGIQAVLAKSFARTYYRNAVNNGLTPIECDTDDFEEGDRLTILLDPKEVRVRNEPRGFEVIGRPVTGVASDILMAGGIVPYMRRHGGFGASP
jgi:3-isopropylmalate/(R)-2-methylmalate dehydratase small subunit